MARTGRPSSDDPRAQIASVALSAAELAALEAHVKRCREAHGETITRSSVLRAIVLDAIRSAPV